MTASAAKKLKDAAGVANVAIKKEPAKKAVPVVSQQPRQINVVTTKRAQRCHVAHQRRTQRRHVAHQRRVTVALQKRLLNKMPQKLLSQSVAKRSQLKLK